MVTYGAVKGAPKGAFILTLDSPVSYFTIEPGTKRNAVQLSFVPVVECFPLFFFLGPPPGHPHSASPLWRSPSSSSFRFGHRTFWICFEPSPLGDSSRRHPTVAVLLSAL